MSYISRPGNFNDVPFWILIILAGSLLVSIVVILVQFIISLIK
jgi:hypothetical protein